MELYVVLVFIAVLFFLVSGIPLCIRFCYIAHIRALKRRRNSNPFDDYTNQSPRNPYQTKQGNVIYSQLQADNYNYQEQDTPKIKSQNYYNKAQSDSNENSSYNSYSTTPQKKGGHQAIEQVNNSQPHQGNQIIQQQSSLENYIQRLQQEQRENQKEQNTYQKQKPKDVEKIKDGRQKQNKVYHKAKNSSFQSPPQIYNNQLAEQPKEWQFTDSGDLSSIDLVQDTSQQKNQPLKGNNSNKTSQGYKVKYELV